MEVTHLRKNIFVYYLALFFESVAIAFPHAILTLIFLNKGIQIYEIALIQSMYSIAMVVFEFPSGVLADRYKKKYVFLASDFFLIGTYILVLKYHHLSALMLAWFLYGIASALKTGTLDAQIILDIRNNPQFSVNVEKFIGTQSRISAFSAILGSGLGFFLYTIFDVHIYYMMIFSVAVSFCIIFICFDDKDKPLEKKNTNLKRIVIEAWRELKNNKNLKLILLGMGLVQMYMQVHFQLWQSYFLSIGLDSKYFYMVYLVFQATSFLVFSLKIEQCISKYLNSMSIIFLTAMLFPIFYSNLVTNWLPYFISFFLGYKNILHSFIVFCCTGIGLFWGVYYFKEII